jgi:hypothetical protein
MLEERTEVLWVFIVAVAIVNGLLAARLIIAAWLLHRERTEMTVPLPQARKFPVSPFQGKTSTAETATVALPKEESSSQWGRT